MITHSINFKMVDLIENEILEVKFQETEPEIALLLWKTNTKNEELKSKQTSSISYDENTTANLSMGRYQDFRVENGPFKYKDRILWNHE